LGRGFPLERRYKTERAGASQCFASLRTAHPQPPSSIFVAGAKVGFAPAKPPRPGTCQLLTCHLLFPEPPGLHAPGFRHLSATSHARHDFRGRALRRRSCWRVPRPQCSPLDFGASPSRAAPVAQHQPVAPEAERGTLRLRNVPFEGNLGGSDADGVMRSGSSQVVQPRGTGPGTLNPFCSLKWLAACTKVSRSAAGTTWLCACVRPSLSQGRRCRGGYQGSPPVRS
jgi:hypothetical protein